MSSKMGLSGPCVMGALVFFLGAVSGLKVEFEDYWGQIDLRVGK